MRECRFLVLPILAALFFPTTSFAAEWKLEQMLGRDAQGRTVYRARPIEERFRNPISEREEAAIQERARHIVAEQSQRKVPAGNTHFENEKRTYGYLMAQALGERGLEAVRDLQVEDAQRDEWHRETRGIDFFAAFTLKHQMRKYFYFGELLEPEYRRRMFEGGKAWTAKDPLRRPHHAFKGNGEGWGPDRKNSWVDVRSTENPLLMRVRSVYIMRKATDT